MTMVAEPISKRRLPQDLTSYYERAPFTLLHGVDDDVIPVAISEEFAANLRRHAWPVEVAALPTDHAAIAGAEYDKAGDRYTAAHGPGALAVAADVAARIAKLAVQSTA